MDTDCRRRNLCVDCDDQSCPKRGHIISDCPKWVCDECKKDCRECEFIRDYQREMRRVYELDRK